MPQINIIFKARVKEGLEKEFYKIASEIMKSTIAEEKDCITFIFHQHANDPSVFVAYEQYRNQEAMNYHFERLAKIYGSPEKGEVLPAKLRNFFEDFEGDMYDVVE